MIKVGIEGSLFFKRGSGVSTYAKKLTEAASKIDSNTQFEIVRHWLPFKKFTAPIPITSHLKYRLVKWFPPVVYFQVFKRFGTFIPYDLLALKRYKYFLFFNFVSFPLSKKTKGIIVVHDLAFLYFPEYIQAKNLAYLKRFLPKSVKRAAYIITVSENSKKDIIKHYKVPSEKIVVIPNAIDPGIFKPANKTEINHVKEKYRLPKKYIHFHGNIEPRKNIQGLLSAYELLPSKLKTEYSLVLSGGKGWNDDQIHSQIAKLKKTGHEIVLTGYVDNEDGLAAIYSGASLFVYPSFYEGFGIPPLEAMACGIPVITSNASSLPEVVGDAAILVSPQDAPQLSKEIAKVLSNAKLRKNMIDRGLARARMFSWDSSAKKLIELLEK